MQFIDYFTGRKVKENCIIVKYEEKTIITTPAALRKHSCSNCGIITKDIIKIDGRVYCKDCFDNLPKCKICGEVSIDRDICFSCLQKEQLYYCPDCGEYHKGDYACKLTRIKNYGYKPSPLFRKEKFEKIEKTLFFGLEIETSTKMVDKGMIALEAQKMANGLMYAKSDSSISGFEMVFHPISKRWFNNNKDIFIKLFDYLKKHKVDGYRVGEAGMHIHVNKNIWTVGQIYRAMKVFDKEDDLIKTISMRDVDRLNYWADIRDNRILEISIDRKGTDHQEALNLTENTIEFRIFRSSLEIETLERNIEFISLLYEYTKHKRIIPFRRFIRDNSKNIRTFIDTFEGVEFIEEQN